MQNEFISSVARLFDRDLKKLEDEIRQYPTEESLWRTGGQIGNAAGNLALHLCGNLQHYVGKILGNSGYVRDRDREFSARDVVMEKVLEQIAVTRQIVQSTLKGLDPNGLEKPYPEKVFDYPMTTAYFLIHLAGHLNYHLGQINYHRRLLT